MNDHEMNGSCSQIRLPPNISAKCFSESAADISYCNTIQTVIFVLKTDCYIGRVFLLLAGMLIVIGTIFNLFSLYCFLKMKKRSFQNIYLSILSLGDTINLHINFTLPIIRQNSDFDDFFRESSILCRVFGLSGEFFLIFPTWIVVLLVLERLTFIRYPSKHRSLYTKKRAKASIAVLAIIVAFLSFYRLFDLKGIDQISVFPVMACNDADVTVDIMRNINLMIWAVIPECCTLIMSLMIIYQIKLAKKKLQPPYSTTRRFQYNQATKIVLLISILFFCFHTPTGILIALDLFYARENKTLGIMIILVARKFTIILYEISLCCKFFIYNQTFRNFNTMLRSSISRFMQRTSSAKLGRPNMTASHDHSQHRTIHFGPKKQETFGTSPTDSLIKKPEESHEILKTHTRRTRSTSLSKPNRDQHAITTKNDRWADRSTSKPHEFSARFASDRRRTLRLTGHQITL